MRERATEGWPARVKELARLNQRTRCARREGGGKGKMEETDWFGFFKPRIGRIFTNSALPSDCCSGVSMSARGSSDSAVIDSRYKPAWQRECLSRSRRPCSPLSRSGALFAEDSSCWVLFVFIREVRGSEMFNAWTSEQDGFNRLVRKSNMPGYFPM